MFLAPVTPDLKDDATKAVELPLGWDILCPSLSQGLLAHWPVPGRHVLHETALLHGLLNYHPVTETWSEKRTCGSGGSQVLPDCSGQDPEKWDCWPGSGLLSLTQTRGRQKLVTAWIHNFHNRLHNCKDTEEKSHDIDDPRANPEGPSPSRYSAKVLWVPSHTRNLNKNLQNISKCGM